MSDQADGLRELMRAHSGVAAVAELPESAREAPARARSLVFTSGKGGVGTSNLALNLAIALADLGQRVVLVDADFGLANIDLLCGLTPACDLGNVLSGDAPLADAVIDGPSGVRMIPGAHGMRTLMDVLADGPARLAAELADLESDADFLLVDAGSGLNSGIPTLAAAADELVLVTTPEPTSIADAHAGIQRYRRVPGSPRLRAVVNQAASADEASDVLTRLSASSRQFLGTVVTALGYVRADPRVAQAVRMRRPFLVAYPGALASRGVRRLAQTLVEERRPRSRRPGFFQVLTARWALRRVAS